ncbi:cupin domain-containing protein [Pokkaliibacter sp. CJK22405]|uniref:(R)-mandelonitrile lyase n=1 Tax=Pokkaliibacter sp. CJK22405 TaxID=3384615 RepID=UPI00398531B5
MKRLTSLAAALLVTASTCVSADSMTISPNASHEVMMGSPDFFTGQVMVEMQFPANDTHTSSAGKVTFSPGARSAWHTHPAGQYLIVTEGTGWVQEWGQEKQVIQPGDVVWTPPGVKHWHGATDKTSMSHLALTSQSEGKKGVEWLEQVSDEQYTGK